ncbi:MAG: nucleotidyltransferase domain-containing protein [Ilumatobacter sp.]
MPVRDPLEGLTATGQIRTGAGIERIPVRYVDLLDAAVQRVGRDESDASVYVYGSVATGAARSPQSDVDLLTVGVSMDRAASIGRSLSTEFSALCRGVEIAAAMTDDFRGGDDEAYGARVFLHHYCVRLAGPEIDRATSPFPGDRRAARGFNGDIARHLARWRQRLGDSDAGVLGRVVARKTLLAVAGLASVHDAVWTTDRSDAVERWSQASPDLADGLDELLDWSAQRSSATSVRLAHHLATTVEQIADQFAAAVGLWPT